MTNLVRAAILASLVICLHSPPATAQDLTPPDRGDMQDSLDAAVSLLAAKGYVMPVAVQGRILIGYGRSTTSLGRYLPQNHQVPNVILVNPMHFWTYYGLDPSIGLDANTLFPVILHEWAHAAEDHGLAPNLGPPGSPPYNTVPRVCGDIQLIPGVMKATCDFIKTLPSPDRGPLCDLYNAMKDNYNGTGSGSGASQSHADNCPGTPSYPGDIPSCGGCPN